MEARRAVTQRRTKETQVKVELGLDGRGQAEVATGIGFLDHLLTQLVQHGLFDLSLKAQGDLEVDAHHTVEDVAIALGRALNEALGERRGLRRMGHAYAPLDEALAFVALDLGGRGYAVVGAAFDGLTLGTLPAGLVHHFLETLAREGRLNLHARVLYGSNDHHKAEALFKALGRALDVASQRDPRLAEEIPSTKGQIG